MMQKDYYYHQLNLMIQFYSLNTKSLSILKEEVPEDYYTVPLGKADVKREGNDITVFTYGLMVNYCLQAADILAEDGINVEVVDLRTVYARISGF